MIGLLLILQDEAVWKAEIGSEFVESYGATAERILLIAHPGYHEKPRRSKLQAWDLRTGKMEWSCEVAEPIRRARSDTGLYVGWGWKPLDPKHYYSHDPDDPGLVKVVDLDDGKVIEIKHDARCSFIAEGGHLVVSSESAVECFSAGGESRFKWPGEKIFASDVRVSPDAIYVADRTGVTRLDLTGKVRWTARYPEPWGTIGGLGVTCIVGDSLVAQYHPGAAVFDLETGQVREVKRAESGSRGDYVRGVAGIARSESSSWILFRTSGDGLLPMEPGKRKYGRPIKGIERIEDAGEHTILVYDLRDEKNERLRAIDVRTGKNSWTRGADEGGIAFGGARVATLVPDRKAGTVSVRIDRLDGGEPVVLWAMDDPEWSREFLSTQERDPEAAANLYSLRRFPEGFSLVVKDRVLVFREDEPTPQPLQWKDPDATPCVLHCSNDLAIVALKKAGRTILCAYRLKAP